MPRAPLSEAEFSTLMVELSPEEVELSTREFRCCQVYH